MTSTPQDAETGSVTQSLDRALALLELVVDHARSGITLGAVVEATQLKKPTAHRLLAGLRNAGLVDYDAHTRLFSPSFKLFQMGQAVGARFDVLRFATPSLERLAESTEDTVHLSVRHGDASICIARRIGAFPIKTLTLEVGDSRPLGLGAGSLALLASLPDAEVAEAIANNRAPLEKYPHHSPDGLWAQVAQTREQGYALNDGLMLPDMAGLGVVIREPRGSVCGAISVAAIRSRLQPPRRESVLGLLNEEVGRIEAALRVPG